MKPTRTWILVADGTCGRILSHAGSGRTLKAVPGLSFASDTPRSRRFLSESKKHVAEGLPAAVARTLEGQLAEGAFDCLILVAPGNVREALRSAMSERLRAKIRCELELNLTKMPNSELARYLVEVLAA